MMQYLIPATGLLFTLENILWINIGVFIGSVFAAIPETERNSLCNFIFACNLYHVSNSGHDVPAWNILCRRLWRQCFCDFD